MKKLMIIILTAALVFGVACGKGEDVTENPKNVNSEGETGEVSGEKPPVGQPTLVCLAEKLKVYAKPGTASEVVGEISRGEQVQYPDDIEIVQDDPSGYEAWSNIRLSDGTEGWVAWMFVIDYEAYKQIEDVDWAAKTGDSAKTEAAITVFVDEANDTEDGSGREYSQSPDGKMFAIPNDEYGLYSSGYMVTVGYGVSSRAPMGSFRTWVYGSRYWYVLTDVCSDEGLYVYESDSMKQVFTTSIMRGDYEFLDDPEILIWPTPIERDKIEYPLVNGPAADPNVPEDLYDAGMPCLMVYEFATGNSYMAAASDLTTRSKPKEGLGYGVTLKPTERFTANPLFGVVSNMKIYREWVGKPLSGFYSDSMF